MDGGLSTERLDMIAMGLGDNAGTVAGKEEMLWMVRRLVEMVCDCLKKEECRKGAGGGGGGGVTLARKPLKRWILSNAPK